MFHKEESPISDCTNWTMNTMNMREEHNCDMKTEEHLYRIGLFAQINRVSVKTLRFYEKQDLLIPVKIDEETGYRYYTMSQMSELHRILALKEAGLTIEDIKKLTMCPNETNFIHQKKNEILAKIADLTLQLSRLEGYLDSDSSTLSNPVMVKTIPAVICACMQSEITSYDELFDLIRSLPSAKPVKARGTVRKHFPISTMVKILKKFCPCRQMKHMNSSMTIKRSGNICRQ